MIPKTKVEIFCTSNDHSLQRIYTGFRMLEQQGEINLSYQIYKNRRPFPALESLSWPMNLLVKINASKLLLFDMNDMDGIWWKDLEQVDFYFKRSFSAQNIGPDFAYKKVFPFGLNYMLYENRPSWFALRRIVLEKTASKMLKSAIATLGFLNLFSTRLYHLSAGNGYAEPDVSLKPGVIFMTRLWDPQRYQGIDRENTIAMNEFRVDCIRKLRKAFGSCFLGGLDPNDYAYVPRQFADCLVEDACSCSQGNYFRLLKQYPIAVTTRGLGNSTGFKFAEYLAFSRAIVSEKLYFQEPGLEAGKHYLEFTSADECVEAVSTLLEDAQLRQKLMEQSHAYYQQYLPPDVTMRRILSLASGGLS